MKKILFITENGHTGKVPRNFSQMRTEFAWMNALDADHLPLWGMPLDTVMMLGKSYDLAIIVLPKKNINNVIKLNLLNKIRNLCNKIAVMQEGPNWYWTDWEIKYQIWYYNFLMEMDVIFCHNEIDQRYYKGLIPNKPCHVLQSLMITDFVEESEVKKEKSALIGGNFCSWYSGWESMVVAKEYSDNVWSVSMGRKKDNEELLPITHLPYMNWLDWMTELSSYEIGVNMMRTYAAGTFALNCAYFGIPCIGYNGIDTQNKLHWMISVYDGDLLKARECARYLRTNKKSYNHISKTVKHAYEKHYSENVWLEKWDLIEKDIFK